MKAFDLSKHQRLIGTEGRISGTFAVLGGTKSGDTWITTHDVTIYDETRKWGSVLGSKDLTGSVKSGVAEYRIYNARLKDAFEEVHELMLETMLLVARAFEAGEGSVIDSEVVSR